MNAYTSIEDFLKATQYPCVEELFNFLRSQPDYSEEDSSWVQKYEAYGGEFAPPGALTLRQHDLVHYLLGVNFIAYNTTDQRKDSERFLSGFQFGCDPNFTNEDAKKFVKTVIQTAPEEYKFGERGLEKFYKGIELGRKWYEARNPSRSLRKFLQDCIDKNVALHQMHFLFWRPVALQENGSPAPALDIADNMRRCGALDTIQNEIFFKILNETREGVRESIGFPHSWQIGRGGASSLMISGVVRKPDGQTGFKIGGPGVYL